MAAVDGGYLMHKLLIDGYCVYPDVLSKKEIDSALAVVNDLQNSSPNKYTIFTSSEELISIYNTKISSIILNSLLETPILHNNTQETHISINPFAQTGVPYSTRERRLHIDGVSMNLDENGVQLNGGILPYTFTVLCGVALTDQSDVSKGCLEVLPGSHRVISRYFREQLDLNSAAIIGPGHGLWPAGVHLPPPIVDLEPALINSFRERKLTPILMNAGDVLVCNYHLAHRRGYNMSTSDRVNLYWRVDSAECAAKKAERVSDFLGDECSGFSQPIKDLKKRIYLG
eukprot:gene27509-36296_t